MKCSFNKENKSIRMKTSILLFLKFICFLNSSFAQDSLYTKRGKYIVCSVKEIYKNTYIIYTQEEKPEHQKINCDLLTYISLYNGTKIYYVPKSTLVSYRQFDSISKPFVSGIYLTPTGLHSGVYISYFFNKRNFAKISVGYKVKCPQAFDEVLNFLSHRANGLYTGPIIQIRWGHLNKRVPHQGIRNSNFVYDFRYRVVSKYYWIDGSPGMSSTYREYRSEQVYAHSLLYILSTTYHISTKLDCGLFLGGGVQWGHKRIHHYASKNNSISPTNLHDRFSSESLFFPIFRLGVFIEFTLVR